MWKAIVLVLTLAICMLTSQALNISSPMKVVLTREKGKNDKLMRQLANEERLKESKIMLEEIPAIEHADGPDSSKLVPFLQRQRYSAFTSDYVVITSPEAAHVFSIAYELSERPYIGHVAAVGAATRKTLEKLGIDVAFVPSKATAATLVKELPEVTTDSATRVLYPASLQAKTTLEDGLRERGFEVTRLNTYDTVPSVFTSEQVKSAKSANIVCFGSPSAVYSFVKNIGQDEAIKIPAACIGETSAKACREMNWSEENIFYPESNPGIEGWAQSVAEAVIKLQANVLQ